MVHPPYTSSPLRLLRSLLPFQSLAKSRPLTGKDQPELTSFSLRLLWGPSPLLSWESPVIIIHLLSGILISGFVRGSVLFVFVHLHGTSATHVCFHGLQGGRMVCALPSSTPRQGASWSFGGSGPQGLAQNFTFFCFLPPGDRPKYFR